MKRIYLDNASLTPTRKEVLAEMKKYYGQEYGNPSSIHTEGVKAKKALETARKNTAGFLAALPDEIIFTGSGTEANNIAILGYVEHLIAQGKKYKDLHVVTSIIEHASVLEVFHELERRGAAVTYIGVDEEGIVKTEEIKKALNSHTVLVSIMYVNNEIGTIQPISEIGKTIRHFIKHQPVEQSIIFHTDASQAPLYLPVEPLKLGVDLLTLDGHKIYGPRGIGILYIKRGITLTLITKGGGQEAGLRSATENLTAIMGFAKALELACGEREKETTRLATLRDYCIDRLLINPKITLNGSRQSRIANNVHISIIGTDTEFLVLKFDAKGIAASTKSSCLRDEDESYVLRAIGKSDPKNGIRFTFGKETTKKDVDYLINMLQLA